MEFIPENGVSPKLLFTDNETNNERLFKVGNRTPYVRDAFHRYVINGKWLIHFWLAYLNCSLIVSGFYIV